MSFTSPQCLPRTMFMFHPSLRGTLRYSAANIFTIIYIRVDLRVPCEFRKLTFPQSPSLRSRPVCIPGVPPNNLATIGRRPEKPTLARRERRQVLVSKDLRGLEQFTIKVTIMTWPAVIKRRHGRDLLQRFQEIVPGF